MKRILPAEDDLEIQSFLTLQLQSDSCSLDACTRGEDALRILNQKSFDLIILNVSLPDRNGLGICKTIRQSDPSTPMMMLTCLGEEKDNVLALELGADDYMTKPFGILELKARTKALISRGNQQQQPLVPGGKQLIYKDLIIDTGKRKATIRGSRLELTPKEFDLLTRLAGNPRKSFSRYELLAEVWGLNFDGYQHTITSHINRLRITVEKDLHNPEYIFTAWGTGYRFAE